jgi:tRNA pseudouridine55 synthase
MRRSNTHGVLLLDKPAGITSQTAVSRAKALLNAAKAGHTGTLDPMATGLLPLTFGEATKFSQPLLTADKGYIARVRPGQTTTTGDLEGTVVTRSAVRPDSSMLSDVLARYRGEIDQVPPMFSALKHAGRPLYEYARAGTTVVREKRCITIHSLELLETAADEIVIEVHCSKGTYVRVLAEDIGQALGCGACLSGLRRTRVGPFKVDDAVTLPALQAMPESARLEQLRPMDTIVADLPSVILDDEQSRHIGYGRSIDYGAPVPSGLVRIYSPGAGFLGLGQALDTGRIEPRRLVAATSRIG